MLPFVERVCVEHFELKEKYIALTKFLGNAELIKTLHPEDLSLLQKQHTSMADYAFILTQRLLRLTTKEDLEAYTKAPRCMDCKWNHDTPIVIYCGCGRTPDQSKHTYSLKIARTLQTLYTT